MGGTWGGWENELCQWPLTTGVAEGQCINAMTIQVQTVCCCYQSSCSLVCIMTIHDTQDVLVAAINEFLFSL